MKATLLISNAKSFSTEKWVKIVLFIFYAVGCIAAFFPLNQLILPFTPFLLFSTFLVLFYFEDQKDTRLKIWYTFVFIGSFLVEWVGVHKGFLFGEYVYLDNLGYKLDGVPLLIAINWLILAVAGVTFSKKIKLNIYLKAILSAALVVLLDVFIERVCEPLGFWKWSGGMPPLRNYISWWIFMTLFIFLRLKFLKSNNSISIYIYILFFTYFIFQNLALIQL